MYKLLNYFLSSCSSSNKEANPDMSFASFYEGSPKEVLIEDEKPIIHIRKG